MSIVYAQQPQLATYHEIAQVLVDEKIQNKTTAFITLSTVSPLEMRVPQSLDQKIINAANVTSVAITNADPCVLGVNGQTCVIITIYSPSLVESYNITKIQTNSKAIGDTLINDINKEFSLNAQFFEVYVQPKGEFSKALETSGVIVGNRTINVVYTTNQQKSSYLLDSLSTVLLPPEIRNAGGFYDVATKMSQQANSTVTFAITPTINERLLFQLQVSNYIQNKGVVNKMNPLELFGVDSLPRSSYFNGGFFPLNSIFELSVISKNELTITDHGGDIVPTKLQNGQKIPTDLTKAGWIFDPDSGQRITGIYLFGTATNATSDQLSFSIGSSSVQTNQNQTLSGSVISPSPVTDYSIYVIIGIVTAGAAAVYIFMKRK